MRNIELGGVIDSSAIKVIRFAYLMIAIGDT